MDYIIGNPKYDGTLERTIALAFDYNFVTYDKDKFVLFDKAAGFNGIAFELAKRIRERDNELKTKVLEYLKYQSLDGNMARKGLRKELAELVAEPVPIAAPNKE